MTRSIRIYEKKRGNRRTGSERLGSAGEALFFAGLLLIGCASLAILFATLVLPHWRARQAFVKATCVVVDTRLGETRTDSGILYRPEAQIEYRVGDASYRLWTYDVQTIRGRGYTADRQTSQAVIDRLKHGERYVCWYDPADPSVAVLVRSSSWWVWLIFTVPVSCIVIGGAGLFYQLFAWGKSSERKAAIARRTSKLAMIGAQHKDEPLPYVPSGSSFTDSPGTTLAYRLPIASSPAWQLLVWLTVCLLWNGAVAVAVALVLGEHLVGEPDWLRAAFILPFALIGIGLTIFFVRQLVITTAIGPTLVEISELPLLPGNRYRLFLHQPGRLHMQSLEVLLVCDEQTTFRQGTDTRKESRRVYEQPVLRQEGLEVERGRPFEAGCELEVPAGAMHSFKAGHNEINWKILVRGKPHRWREYERCFPVIVYPRRAANCRI